MNGNNETARAIERVAAALGMPAAAFEQSRASGIYTAVFRDADGSEVWRDEYLNLVTNAGRADMLDRYLAGSGYTAAFFLGLISATSYSAVAATDTMAAHAGWLEAGAANAPAYSETTRRAVAWGAAALDTGTTVRKAASAAAVFTIASPGTARGSFLSTGSAKDGTTGVLFSAGLFNDGDKPVTSPGTLSVTYTASLT